MKMQHIVIFAKRFSVIKKKQRKVCDHDYYAGKYRGAAHSICNLRYSTQKDIPVLFHNVTHYDFNLIIPQLVKEFRCKLQCIPVNTNKYMPFSIPIRKKVFANSKNTKKKLVTHNLRFIDSARHMNKSLSKLVDNLSEISKCNCDDGSLKNIKITCWTSNNKKLVRNRCKTWKLGNDQSYIALTKNFPCTFKLGRNNATKFLLLLIKGLYPYEYMVSF